MNHTRSILLERILAERPDPDAWRSLVASCQEEHGKFADIALTAVLSRHLARLRPSLREALISPLADLLIVTASTNLAPLLAADAEEAGRHLALELMARWPGPLPPELLSALRGLFLDRRLPEAAQLSAAVALLRNLGPDNTTAEDLLRTLVSGLGKVRSINRLRKLEERVGSHPVIEALCDQLEERVRLSCPHCNIELRRPEMARHLWDNHHLLLVGRRVREPWSVIEEWIDLCKAGGPRERLELARNLAQNLDAEGGLMKVNRLIVSRGVDDARARQYILQDAVEKHASVCPRCFAAIPIPLETTPWALTHRKGRLSAHSYLVDVSERGFRTRLEVRSPSRLVYLGQEPGLPWTRRGILFVLVGPFVALALACALGEVEWWGSVLAPVVFCLTLGIVAYGGVRWSLRKRPRPARRALSYAWTVLAPRLHEDRFQRDDASFLAALAELSKGSEHANERAAVLPRLIEVTEQALAGGEATPFHLAALCLRKIADSADTGPSPEERIASLAARCFAGKLPLAFVDALLTCWRKEFHSAGSEARLRILLCDRAFEAGFEVRTLIDAGQTAPVLGEVLRVNRTSELAALRLLWSLRPARPWNRCGPALTAFDLAADPVYEALLTELPDVLFLQTDRHWPLELDVDDVLIPFRIAVRACGLMIQNELFTEQPRYVRLRGRMDSMEVVVDDKHFRSEGDLEPLADRVQAWIWLFFDQFRPRFGEVLDWQSPEKAAIWHAWGAAACPGCGLPVFPQLGEMAAALERDRST